MYKSPAAANFLAVEAAKASIIGLINKLFRYLALDQLIYNFIKNIKIEKKKIDYFKLELG